MIYTWRTATLHDLDAVVKLAVDQFQNEIDPIFIANPYTYGKNLAYAVLNQSYYPNSELLSVALAADNRLLAFTWIKANDKPIWSDDLVATVRMVHVDLKLPARLRLQLIKDMMLQWEQLAHNARNPVIASTTIRTDSAAFMRLHEQAGYTVRGNIAYKRIQLSTT